MRVINFIIGDAVNNERYRKVTQFLAKQGHRVICIYGIPSATPRLNILTQVSKLDNHEAYEVDLANPNLVAPALESRGASIIYCHTLLSAWILSAVFTDEAARRLNSGWRIQDAGIKLGQFSASIFYDPHEVISAEALGEAMYNKALWKEDFIMQGVKTVIASTPEISRYYSLRYKTNPVIVPDNNNIIAEFNLGRLFV